MRSCARRIAACGCACCSTTSARTRTMRSCSRSRRIRTCRMRLFNPVASRRFKTLRHRPRILRASTSADAQQVDDCRQPGRHPRRSQYRRRILRRLDDGRVRRSRRARARAGGARGVERLRSILELAGRLSDREPDRPSRRPRRARGPPRRRARRIPRVATQDHRRISRRRARA